jgi:hypothetical protein
MSTAAVTPLSTLPVATAAGAPPALIHGDDRAVFLNVHDLSIATTGRDYTATWEQLRKALLGATEANFTASDPLSVGNITATGTLTIGGLTYTFPASQVANGILKTDGAGNLAWVLADTLTNLTLTGFLTVGGLSTLTGGLVVGADPGGAQLARVGGTFHASGAATFDAAATITGVATLAAGTAAALTFGTHLTGGSYNSSANVTLATDATNLNTVSTIVSRDAGGNFSAGTITANLTGTATNAPWSGITGTPTTLAGYGIASPLNVAQGGTGLSTFTAAGAIAYSTAATALAALAAGSAAQFLQMNAGATAPQWHTLVAADVTNPAALTAGNDTNVTLTLGGTPASALLVAASITAGWTGTLAAARLNANVVQSVVNDTNVQGSIAAQALTLAWAGTLAAGRLNANVVQAITNDTNVTGSIAAQTLTLGWSGTLAAGRLNASVVQAITNDTNVTGSIAAQNLTLGWTGQLAVGRGGTGLSTFTAAGGMAYATGATTLAVLAIGSAAQFLQVNPGATAPQWHTLVTADITDLTSAATGITKVGTVTTGTWNAAVLTGQYGGTGVANTGFTITLGGNLTTSGAFNTTLTVTAGTNVTLPTTGTLVNTAVTTLSSLASIGTITTGVWNGSVVVTTYGGTGLASFTAGDLPYYAAGTALSKLAIGAANTVLTSSGSAPQWSANIAYAALPTGAGSWDAGAGNLITITRALTVSGLLTASGGITVTGGAAAAGTWYKNASYGVAIQAAAGSTYDFILANPGNTNAILYVPTGTLNVVIAGGFGCNGAAAQTAYASGGALAAYGAGANGFDTPAHAQSLYNMVVSIRAALVANGIMS